MFHILYCSTRISYFFLLLPHPIFINKNCCCYVLVFLRTLPRCGAVRCGAVRCSAVRFSAGVWMGLRSVASFLAPPFGHLPAPPTHPPTYLPTYQVPTYVPTYLPTYLPTAGAEASTTKYCYCGWCCFCCTYNPEVGTNRLK